MERLDGLNLAQSLEKNLKSTFDRLRKRRGLQVKLGVVHDQGALNLYFVGRQIEVWRKLGLVAEQHDIKAGGEPALRKAIKKLNADPSVAGFTIHWPLEGVAADLFSVTEQINPAKDIDGLTPRHRLRPGSDQFQPGFIMALDKILIANSIDPAGKRVCVVGRSDSAGRALADHFLTKDATVTVCHSRTKDLHRHTREAELVVLAAGRPNLIGAAHVSAGAVVVDVGATLTETPEGPIVVGDANTVSLDAKAGRLIPVPSGVDSLAPYMVAANALKAAGALPANLQSDLAFIKVAS